jgi:hypothetical protein
VSAVGEYATSSLDIARDPFGESATRTSRWRARVLGATFEFSSNSRELLSLAQEAFASVPQHRWPRSFRRTLRISLMHVRDGESPSWTTPPKPVLSSGGGLLCGHVDSHNFVVADPCADRALLQVGDAMLKHRDLVRYEMIEFAAITLATRAQGLVSLHAGCVGSGGRGVLLVGSSGAGKSTLALHAAFDGFDFLAEDSVFVQPASMCATGLSAFVHAREDAIRLFDDHESRQVAGRSPLIQRRSGVRKHEIDLRRGRARLAPKPLRIVATVVVSSRHVPGAPPMEPLTSKELKNILRSEQSYAIGQPGWREFEQRLLHAGGYRLNRVPPSDGVSALRALFENHRS